MSKIKFTYDLVDTDDIGIYGIILECNVDWPITPQWGVTMSVFSDNDDEGGPFYEWDEIQFKLVAYDLGDDFYWCEIISKFTLPKRNNRSDFIDMVKNFVSFGWKPADYYSRDFISREEWDEILSAYSNTRSIAGS
jgi:hypothetical protein